MPSDAARRPAPTREQLDRFAQGFNKSGVLKTMSAQLSFPEPADRVVIRVDPILPYHRGGLGSSAVNGGMLAALFDLAIGCTAALVDPTKKTATMQLSMSFERPVRGDRITVEGRIDRAGGSTVFASALILDQDGAVCSRCTGLLRVSHIPLEPDWQFGSK